MGMDSTYSYSRSPYLSLKAWNGVEIVIFIFERYIHAEVVTYRSDVVFVSLHVQRLHGFDEFRNGRWIIQNRSAKADTAALSFYLLASYFSFRFLPLAIKIERWKVAKVVFFGRSNGGK
jgi:hypothetical protein